MNSTTLTEAGQLAFDNLKLLRRAVDTLELAAWRDEALEDVCGVRELAEELEALADELTHLHHRDAEEVAA
ncbi:hypothetical protein [uncultured Tessaracoccus sp.]|uniref:hypothetical protein n=1 Tax=uncultured Tessaracoccus sp. TaxID=905023 RepID=UPI0025F6E349|nr:hypothetical protein [uncultured Tessaracoccus sp.]